MVSGDLFNRPLHNCLVEPGFAESPHVFAIKWREAGHVGEVMAEVGGEVVNDPVNRRLLGTQINTCYADLTLALRVIRGRSYTSELTLTAERCFLSACSPKARDRSGNRGFVDSLAPMCGWGTVESTSARVGPTTPTRRARDWARRSIRPSCALDTQTRAWLDSRGNSPSNLRAQSAGVSPFRFDESLRFRIGVARRERFLRGPPALRSSVDARHVLEAHLAEELRLRSDRMPPWQIRYNGRSRGTSLKRVARSA